MITFAVIHAARATERVSMVEAIMRQLPDAKLLVDEDGRGDFHVANRRGCWPMAREAWLSAPADATHHVVLEDDAVLCAGFVELVSDAVLRAPRAAISLFRGPRHCSVGTVLPVEVIGRLVAWADAAIPRRPHHDQLLDLGLEALGVEHLYTSPSLVEHGAVASLLDHPPVRAFSFDPAPLSFALET